MSLELIIVGIIMLVIGIILGHFFPSKYWLALVAVGIVIMVIGVILLALASFIVLPYVPIR